jgi:hypothetical protein
MSAVRKEAVALDDMKIRMAEMEELKVFPYFSFFPHQFHLIFHSLCRYDLPNKPRESFTAPKIHRSNRDPKTVLIIQAQRSSTTRIWNCEKKPQLSFLADID